MELDNEEYKCKFCDNKIIAGYRCVDCYINKIDKIPDNPYKEDDFMKGYEDQVIPDPFAGLHPDNRLKIPGYPYIPLTGTSAGSTIPFDWKFNIDAETTTSGEPVGTYNPWFRDTWQYQYKTVPTSDSTNVGFSTSTNSQDFTN